MVPNKIRKPVAAGHFYSASALELKKQIESFINKKASKVDVLACLLPHAGYIYSGMVAVETLSCVKVPNRVIVLGPNHTGHGYRYSITASGLWQTPLGNVEIDTELANLLMRNSRLLVEDDLAHKAEHSIEVELPLLQYFNPDFKFVPIALLSEDFDSLVSLGKDIAHTIKDSSLKGPVLLAASSDMTHYEPQESAAKKDSLAIKAILDFDAGALMDNIRKFAITMCGFAPAIVMITAAKELGGKNSKLIKYQTSGNSSGDFESVVGYAGIVLS